MPYLGELVAINNAESLSIECEIYAQVEVLNKVELGRVFGDAVSLDENALGNAAVLNGGLHNGNRVIFQEVMDENLSQVILLRRFMDRLLEVGVKAEDL
jgi:hypothetical protein